MIRHYFNIALRSFMRNKIFSFINVGGLSIGLAAFLLIMHYVQFEKSFDSFSPYADDIYRVQLNAYQNGELALSSAENYPGVGPAMVEQFPEVLSSTRLYNMGYKNNLIITWEEAPGEPVSFKHRRFLYADSAFLPMMGYELVKGDAQTALAQPLQAVISERYAALYFKGADPIGKMLRLRDDDQNNELCQVTGVFKDVPANSHLQFDVLFSYATLYTRGDWAPERYNSTWDRNDMYTYVRMLPGTNPAQVESRLADLMLQYKPDQGEQGITESLLLQPLQSIHLLSNLAEEQQVNGDAQSIKILSWIGLFVLIIAWVNYINLATAKAMERAREVGVRKTMGAWRAQLIRQFMIEAAITNLLAMVIAFCWMTLSLGLFNSISGYTFSPNDLIQPRLLGIAALTWLLGSICAGFYPAFVMSSFNPVETLKGKLINKSSGVWLRKGLVIFQFVASVTLIASTLIVQGQLNYLMSQDIGMDTEQVLVIERPGVIPSDRSEYNTSIDVFRGELAQLPAVREVTSMLTVPGKKREYKVPMKPYGSADDALQVMRINSMDYATVDVFDMELLAGRPFGRAFANDPDTSLILTASAVKALGYEPEEIVGRAVDIPAFGWSPVVVGVVNDYHQESLKKRRDPIAFYCTIYGGEFFALKLNSSATASNIAAIEQAWQTAFPGNPMDFFFLDEYFNRQYVNDQRFSGLISVFSILAIVLGCLGLFGLSAYLARQKTKEIGIRKVLGSTVLGIFLLLSQEFIKLIGIAIVIAIPLTILAMREWLSGFAYRDSMEVMTFVLAAFVVLLIAVLTISYHTLRAARSNPVRALRYE